MENRIIKLRFREANKDIFDAIKNGKKKVETRAATKRYRDFKKGDRAVFACGKNGFEKTVKNVKIFKTIAGLLKKYKVKEINPRLSSEKELKEMYYNFPGYKEKIKKCGLVAIELR